MEAKIDILVVSGVSAGDIFHFNLATDQQIVIGRLPGSEIVLQDPTVSREHAKISLKTDGFYICDTGSSQGTILMGFRLEAGDHGAKKLENGAEFKIGETIFRASFDARLFQKQKKNEPKAVGKTSPLKGVLTSASLNNRKNQILIILLLLLVAVYLSFGNDDVLSRDLSAEKMAFPQGEAIAKITGFYQQGRKAKEKDSSHKHQARFVLPATDVVVEYQIKSEVPVSLSINSQLLERIDSDLKSWDYRQVLVKDSPTSGDRILSFKPEKSASEERKWALKDIRTTPLRLDVDTNTKAELAKVISLCDVFDKSPTSLFDILRATQSLVLVANSELGREAIGFSIKLNQPLPDIRQIREQLLAIDRERRSEVGVERLEKHLELYTQIVNDFDAELWRRVHNRLMKAYFAAKKKNNIEAYDALTAGKAMFSTEDDYRIILFDQMLQDKKIIPKKLLKNPDKFRKQIK